MKYFLISIAFLLSTTITSGQSGQNTAFDKMLKALIDFSVPTISVEQLKQWQKTKKIYLLDAREWQEYQVSHIKGAQYVGYNHFSKKRLKNIPKKGTIVLYCSVGYRSEKVGEKLQQLGYQKVYNLYGSIFQWVNQGNEVVDKNGEPTKRVHAFDKNWSKWLKRGQKVY